MVNNQMCVLDEGEVKNLCYTITMNTTEPLWKQCILKSTKYITERTWNDDEDRMIKTRVDNPDYKEPKGILRQAIRNATACQDVASVDKVSVQWDMNLKLYGITKDDVYDYLDIIPFTPSIMLNISPNWKGQYHLISDDVDGLEPSELADREWQLLENAMMVEDMTTLIETYMKECNRFDYYDYILEVGGEGNMLHAHIVGHVNPRLIKSVCGDATKGSTKTSHFGKGNHVQQLIKVSKGIKGIKGLITRFGIQSSILRKDYLVSDKLDYLVEEKKPEGHKNLYVLWDAPKHVCV